MSDRDLSDPLGHRYKYAASIVQTAKPNVMDTLIDYSNEKLRTESFKEKWPERFKPSITEMVAAGFVFIGPGDFVQCYSCGIKLHLWKKEDDPKEEHKKYQQQKEIICERYPDISVKDF